MCSKKKPNGCKTIGLVSRAAQRKGETLEQFFRASIGSADVHVDAEVEAFHGFEKYGTAMYPHYGVPRFVIDRAVDTLNKKRRRPLKRKRTSESSVRPSVRRFG